MSELMEELLAEDDGRYRIKNDQEAEWAIQQIKNAQDEMAKWNEFYDERKKAVKATCELTIQNMESLLHSYFATVPHKEAKTQESYQLPSGKLVFKKQAPEYKKDDPEVIEWLLKNGGEKFVKTILVLDWDALKKTITVVGETVADENGEVIPGITAVEREDVFKVELKKEE